ncbi:MAG: isoleucine--tRNA ligase [Armatimonadota bacterium]|nr:isoleucine--tRNA ligase [Armatimonadota bacterium]MDR7524238.1 isoleucine--tRNA ligase [Armatimonadota bacterium]MDR7564429.1 isoleucine--tRNA ligase [Armatimonadota bacterium]
MGFSPASPRVNFPELEERILGFWAEQDVFRKTLEARQGCPQFTFYEGPPTANGLPGVHHVLARAYKDAIPRYRTMRGYFVPRKAGWDTHGLPVEIEVEKELGINSKREIEAYGVAEFNRRCKESVFRYEREWVRLSERIGFWLDYEHPYVTYSNEYIESVWWILRQLWDRGLLYQGYKVVPYCPRCGTPLSSHEVALGYRETDDPSVIVRLRLTEQPGTSLLVWTTTPWTLPANVACAVHPQVAYVKARQGDEVLVVAKDLADAVLQGSYEVLEEVRGESLVGLKYEPLFRFYPEGDRLWRVWAAEFVTTEEGTGVVHMAPAYGEEDMELARRHGLPVFHPVGPDGRYTEEVPPWAGRFVKDADPEIVEDLRQRGLLYRAGTYRHTYPFCWRCDSPLLYYARTSWHVAVTRCKEQLLRANEQIRWVPEHIQRGRFGNWLENVVDWALSRERYWGTPLPIWVCEACGLQHCVGSLAELREMAAEPLPQPLDLHRPYVDGVRLRCPRCGGILRRVPDLIDVWFDSGAMPVAQWHYPFENQEWFERSFPADYICEGIDQTRGWFYSLHAISVLLFDRPAYRNCVCLELVLDEHGEKMSKSRGNVLDPWSLIQRFGADALRWFFFSVSPPGMPKRLGPAAVEEVVRRFFLTLWNTYVFFTTYASLDRFDPLRWPAPTVNERPALDRWLLSRLAGLVAEATEAMEAYNPTDAARAVERFVEDLSTWYVRRGRRRYWKARDVQDQRSAYHTLYEALVTTAKVMAPLAPFLSEELYQGLVRAVDDGAPVSVHLTDWPQAREQDRDVELERAMEEARWVASLGRAARSRARIRVRQPLASAVVVAPQSLLHRYPELVEYVSEELNCKRVELVGQDSARVEYEVRPRFDVLGPRYGPKVQELAAALDRLSPAEARRVALEGRAVVELAGEQVELGPEELDVRVRQREGFVAEAGRGFVVVLDTRITPELRREGLVRELVHHVQQARREANLRVDQRIVLSVAGPAEVVEAVREHRAAVAEEVLADRVELARELEGFRREVSILGEPVTLVLQPLP